MNSLSWMSEILPASQVTEVRVFFLGKDGQKYVRNQFYRADQYAELEVEIARLESHPELYGGVYWILNPVNPAIAVRNKGRKPFLTRVASARTTDILRREWLLIDCDPIREKEQPATDQERLRAHQLAADVILNLEAFGFRSLIEADSGNGCHILVPIILPNDESSNSLLKQFLDGLSKHIVRSGVKIDTVTHDAPRLVRLYGTRSKKGESTPDRPHRVTEIRTRRPLAEIEGARASNVGCIRQMLQAWHDVDHEPKSFTAAEACANYLRHVPGAVSGQGGHNHTYRVAMICVEGFGLSKVEAMPLMELWNGTCQPPWSDHDLDRKVNEAIKNADPARIGRLLRSNPKLEQTVAIPQNQGPENKTDASAADLIRLGKTMQWIWPGWIQRGALVSIAAEPGTGKTRFVADLIRRIVNGEPWPDGHAPTLPAGGKIMWIPCDGQWGEICEIPAAFNFPPETVILNAWSDDPTNGTILDEEKQFKELSERISRNNIDLVFVDSAMNATTHGTMRPEDGIKFFVPLMRIASERNCAIILVTHLSKEGVALGRRIVGQVRQLIRIAGPASNPDLQANERAIYVEKSNSKIPIGLIATMHDGGATYRLGVG